eukprot:Lithocolla_globosa_v1_NODE_354_length_4343_cov_21.892024.p5 type:complete len:141 gc:universal NODE_354_length_4343_cov_21.892024:3619-3197(-)
MDLRVVTFVVRDICYKIISVWSVKMGAPIVQTVVVFCVKKDISCLKVLACLVKITARNVLATHLVLPVKQVSFWMASSTAFRVPIIAKCVSAEWVVLTVKKGFLPIQTASVMPVLTTVRIAAFLNVKAVDLVSFSPNPSV